LLRSRATSVRRLVTGDFEGRLIKRACSLCGCVRARRDGEGEGQPCASTNLNCRFVLSSIPRSNQATVIPGGKGHPYAVVHALPGATLVIIFRKGGDYARTQRAAISPDSCFPFPSFLLPCTRTLPLPHRSRACIRDTSAAPSATDFIANIRGRAANSPRAASECNFAAAARVSIYSARGPRMRTLRVRRSTPRRGNFPPRVTESRCVCETRTRVTPSYFFGKSICVVPVQSRASISAHLARTYERIEPSQASETPINYAPTFRSAARIRTTGAL
jgi:hypothetical protein